MLDVVIRGGTVVDGTGAAPRTADVGVRDGRIVEVGTVDGASRETIDADGALVTPGFVDVHTHYDGQVTWDDALEPSAANGVTTLVMGNCGVGFAPARPDDHDALIDLMEGVEDIPGTALSVGMPWGRWETFGEYLDLLEGLLWPELFIIGGGVSRQSDRYLPLIQTRTPIVPAQLHNDAGIVGAALFAPTE